MEDKDRLGLDELVAARQELQTFCFYHFNSLIKFAGTIAFKLHLAEKDPGPDSHLSSTATCIESLLECPTRFLPTKRDEAKLEEFRKRAREFASAALKRPPEKWTSDGAAKIYCRCRTLPLVVSYLEELNSPDPWTDAPPLRESLLVLLTQIFEQSEHNNRLAIGEASSTDSSNWYPPNAYHTYWVLNILDLLHPRTGQDLQRPRPCQCYSHLVDALAAKGLRLERLHHEMLSWAKQIAGNQIALHSSDSSMLDSDQLAWSLAIILRFDDDFQAELSKQNFITFGLKCLFRHQTADGHWRIGEPLFHYPEVGNAYCYVFETFTVLLKATLASRKESAFLRKALLPYAANLLKLWGYAKATRIPFEREREIFHWSSGHRSNNKQPESWATASVYSFLHCLRRLFGMWTREEAGNQRKAKTPGQSSEEAIRVLSVRGDTWKKTAKDHSVACQLTALFVNPIRFARDDLLLEPDSQPIEENQARAAILFGPPGTSKTTLARSVASAIGWDYVEIHASHFVANGLPDVQRTADRIFGELMQLDRTVILFDEIDELVRAREMESDAFGRFLTTSMLPKLAELWETRKVIYFVATNHIKFFDPAIRRAQRFDALICVSPPSFERKMEKLKSLLEGFSDEIDTDFTSVEVENALMRIPQRPGSSPEYRMEIPRQYQMAKFLLIRWDQLDELASLIRDIAGPQKVLTAGVMKKALLRFSEPSFRTCEPFINFRESREYQQFDLSKFSVWEVQGNVPEGLTSYRSTGGFANFEKLSSNCKIFGPGVVRVEG